MKNFNSSSFLYSASIEPLDRETEHELALKALSGDQKSRETLIRANLRFAIKEAGRYRHLKLDYEELVSIAVTGLVNALNHFDPYRNTRLITCAAWWIRAEFKNYIFDDDSISYEESVEGAESVFAIEDPSDSPEEEGVRTCIKNEFLDEVKKLPAIEKDILMMHNGLGGLNRQSFSQLGKLYGKTKQWVCLKERSAQNRLALRLKSWE